MQWLPPSAEGKQLVGLTIMSAVVGLVLITLVQFLLASRVIEGTAGREVAADATAMAAFLERSGRLQVAQDWLSQVRPGDFQVYLVAEDGVVRAASGKDDAGQAWEGIAGRLRGERIGEAPVQLSDFKGTLRLVSPTAHLPLGVSLLLSPLLWLICLLAFVPLILRLNRDFLMPIHRLVEADRRRSDTTGPLAVDPGAVPPGELRDVFLHRNQLLETLRSTQEALSRRSSDMEALYEFSKELGLSREAPDIPGLALSFLARSIDYDVACLLLFSDDQRSITVRSRAPLSELLSAEVEHLALESNYLKSGVLLEEEKLETSVLVGDVRAPRLEGKIRSAHWSGITVERKLVGVMGIMALSEKWFSTDAVRLLNILSQNTSLALEKLHVMRIEETQRFRNVLENLAEGVVLVRQGGEWALATGTARRFHDEICGADPSTSAEHSRRCPIGLLGADVFQGGRSISREITLQDRTFILQGTFVRSAAAGEQGTVISIRDVTEERATQQRLFQASKLASLGELAAGVAHEVNNPLTGILGFTELLLSREDVPGELRETLQEIHALARRTNQITQDLLIFSRVQREGGYKPVDVRPIMRDIIKFVGTSYRSLNLELVEETGPAEVPLVAMGDQGKIQQIVMNLAQNAKDAISMAGKGSKIFFRCYRQKEEIVIEVEDDGPGIPDRVRSKIFEPFFTTKPVGKGTGLGLAIVNRIVEEHKGRLVVDSDEGRGTRFRISLNAAPEGAVPEPRESFVPTRKNGTALPEAEKAREGPAEPTSPEPAPAAAPAVPRGSLVVLDDEETVLKFVARALQADGLKVHATTNPDEAMSLIAEVQPDLLFLDFRMPGLTGEDFYRRVVAAHDRYAHRVVFLTGDATGEEIQGFLKETGAPYLTKPIGIKDLRSFVSNRLTELREAAANTTRG